MIADGGENCGGDLDAGLFFDAAYTEDKKYFATNTLSNKYIWGTGMGIDFVTYYDSVFRFEIAMNDLKEKGFFLHFTAPI